MFLSCGLVESTVEQQYEIFRRGIEARVPGLGERNLPLACWLAGRAESGAENLTALSARAESDPGEGWFRWNSPEHRGWLEPALHESLGRFCDPSARLGNRLAAKSEAALLESLHVLDRIWPEAAYQVRVLVKGVVWFSSPGVCRSSASANAFGVIFLDPRSHWTIPYFLDSLLFECCHLAALLREEGQDPAYQLQRVCAGLMRYATAGPGLPDRADAIRLLEGHARRLRARPA